MSPSAVKYHWTSNNPVNDSLSWLTFVVMQLAGGRGL